MRHGTAQAARGPVLSRESTYQLLAAFPSMKEAGVALEALGRAGIAGNHLTMEGPTAEEASHTGASPRENAAADSRVLKRWFGVVAVWGAVGAVIGAVLGIPIGLAVLEVIARPITVTSVVASAFLGALALSTAAALIAMVYPGQDSDAWELSFHGDWAGHAVVGLHSEDPQEIETARDILDEHGAIEIRSLEPRRWGRTGSPAG